MLGDREFECPIDGRLGACDVAFAADFAVEGHLGSDVGLGDQAEVDDLVDERGDQVVQGRVAP